MEFDYRILGRQQPETAVNAMYPRINAGSAPVIVATDGSDIARTVSLRRTRWSAAQRRR